MKSSMIKNKKKGKKHIYGRIEKPPLLKSIKNNCYFKCFRQQVSATSNFCSWQLLSTET